MTATYRRETATPANRLRQHKAETRIEEIVAVAGIEQTYEVIDRVGDLAVEAQLGKLFRLLDNETERAAAARLFVVWQHSEQAEDTTVRECVGGSVEFIKSHNDLFLEGAFVPEDDGAAA